MARPSNNHAIGYIKIDIKLKIISREILSLDNLKYVNFFIQSPTVTRIMSSFLSNHFDKTTKKNTWGIGVCIVQAKHMHL